MCAFCWSVRSSTSGDSRWELARCCCWSIGVEAGNLEMDLKEEEVNGMWGELKDEFLVSCCCCCSCWAWLVVFSTGETADEHEVLVWSVAVRIVWLLDGGAGMFWMGGVPPACS
jgi:hypothetical protein